MFSHPKKESKNVALGEGLQCPRGMVMMDTFASPTVINKSKFKA